MKSTKQTITTNQAGDILLSKRDIALFAHTNPDGDTIGSCVALCLALQKLGKNVRIFCDTKIDDKLAIFEETKCISNSFTGKYDLLVAVDCGDIFRVGQWSGNYNSFSETMTIDHHGGEYYSKYNLLTKQASTCQIVYDIIKYLGVDIDGKIATYLYMGLCTDTGNFANTNTDEQCFLMAAQMYKKGGDIQKVVRVFFKDTSLAETKLLARVLNRMRTYYDNKLVLLYVTKQDLDELGLDLSSTSMLVPNAVNIDVAQVGVCVSEYSANTYKVSMRSKGFNVREVCQYFGGGGHIVASGCMISGFLEDVIEKIVRVIGYTI